jgi:hypothetical protein
LDFLEKNMQSMGSVSLKTPQFGGDYGRPYKTKPPLYPFAGDILLFLEQGDASHRVSAAILAMEMGSLTATLYGHCGRDLS